MTKAAGPGPPLLSFPVVVPFCSSGVRRFGRPYLVAGTLLVPRIAEYFLSNLSIRPAVSTSFCLPVKNGWQDEQISARISPLCVDRVLKTWPHAQVTFTSL